MKNARKVLCLLLAAALCSGMAACSKKETPKETTTETVAETRQAMTTEAPEDSEDDDDDDAPIDMDNIQIRTTAASEKTTTAAQQTTTAKQTTAAKPTTTAAKTTRSTSKTTAKPSTTTAKATTTAKPTTTVPMTDPAPEADDKLPSGVIDLGSGAYEGEGITVDGGTIRITGSGTYILSGSRTGMVEVNTTEKVKLKLNGVNISNPSGPAILCTDAKRLTITLIAGTYNTLTDGYSGDYDGCICSNDTLEIKGAGGLNVNATNAHGISSDDDIVIKNGDITINAVKTALMANDDITISGGNIRASGGTNGLKSKGTVHISDGHVFLYGGGKETKSALFSGAPFSLTGGYVYAVGCGVSEPDPGSSSQHAIAARFVPSLTAGTTASIVANGIQFIRESSGNPYNTIFVSTPDVYDGMSFNVYVNDQQWGETYTTGGVLSFAEVAQP